MLDETLDFFQLLTKVECYYSYTNTFWSVLLDKVNSKVSFRDDEMYKFCIPFSGQSLLLKTTVLNDTYVEGFIIFL